MEQPPGRTRARFAVGALLGETRGAFVDGTLIGIGLWLLAVPVVFALTVLVFIGSFIPFVGAFLSGLVAVLVAFADGGWKVALAVLVLVVVVQFIEGNFLQPIIQSRTVDLHPALILLAVAAGASLFGRRRLSRRARDRGRLRGGRVFSRRLVSARRDPLALACREGRS